MGVAPSGIAQTAEAMVAIATAPRLAPMAELAGSAPGQPLALARPHADADAGAVLSERASSIGAEADKQRIPARAASTLPAGGEDGTPPWPLLLIISLLAAAAAAVMLFRRGSLAVSPGVGTGASLVPVPRSQEGGKSEGSRAGRAPATAEAPAEPVDQARPWYAGGAWDTEVWRRGRASWGPALPPAREADARRELRAAREPGNLRRAAGIAASGAASVGVGLLFRALRRR